MTPAESPGAGHALHPPGADARGPARSSDRLRTAAIAVLLGFVVAWGALLRCEALIGTYGHLPRPAWTSSLDQASHLASHLRPAHVRYEPDATPYVGGDPVNYLRFAREMRSFYQAHVREPVFLAWAKAWLWVFQDADIGLSAASAVASALVVPAAFLLGAAAFSPWVGLGAALAFAIELRAIGLSVGGWRDDTFTLVVTLAAWGLVRLRRHPTWQCALVAGICAAAAILTRITALTFVVPALAWLVVDAGQALRTRMARLAAASLATALLLVAPYLVSCARQFGDSLHAINYHTQYYRAAEGASAGAPVGALAYVGAKFGSHPLRAIDTASGGLFSFPLRIKFRSFDAWWPGLAALGWTAAVAGLVLALWSAHGRLLLVILFGSLAPYALTWAVGGGGEWRFTEHAYPIYLVLAFESLRMAVAVARRSVRRDFAWARAIAARRRQVAVAAFAVLLVTGAYVSLPCLIARETVLAGEPAMVVAGPRDWCFFRGTWSAPYGSGRNVTLRAAGSERTNIRVPLPAGRPFQLTLRMDPADTADPTRRPAVVVYLDRQRLGEIHWSVQPGRVGTYRFLLPAGFARTTMAELELVASGTVAARDAGPAFRALAGSTPVALCLWYVRIEPLEPGTTSTGSREE